MFKRVFVLAGIVGVAWSIGSVAIAQDFVVEGLDTQTFAGDWMRVDLPDGHRRYVVTNPVYVRGQNRGITVAQFDPTNRVNPSLQIVLTHQSCSSAASMASAGLEVFLSGQVDGPFLIEMSFQPAPETGWFRDLLNWACENDELPGASGPFHGLEAVIADARQ